jgi:hypothetical protein
MKRGSGACDGQRATANKVARSVSSIKQLDVRSVPGSPSTDIQPPGNIGPLHYRQFANKIFSSCANKNLFFAIRCGVVTRRTADTTRPDGESAETDKGSDHPAITRRVTRHIPHMSGAESLISLRARIFAPLQLEYSDRVIESCV